MDNARHRAIPRCAKSLHTPVRSVTVSNAEVEAFVLPLVYSTFLLIHSVMAITFEKSFLIWPNLSKASLLNLSDWQYLLGKINGITSASNLETGIVSRS